MTLSVIGFLSGMAAAFIGGIWLGYDEGRKHSEEDSARAYSRGHHEGFDDGFAASESVNRSIRTIGKANW